MFLHVWLLVDECVGVVVEYDTSIPVNERNATSCIKTGVYGRNGALGRAMAAACAAPDAMVWARRILLRGL